MDTKRRKISDQGNNSSCSSSSSGGGGDAYNVPIRTLHVAAIKPDMNDQIKLYFERFGTVNSVETEQDTDTDTHFAMVEFKSVESAVAALTSKRMHRIDGYKIQVKAAEPCQQPDHILNALDDDCLRSILLQLNLSDLTSAANVCVRFNEQAKSVFSTKFKKALHITECTYGAAKHSLQTFGSLAQSVDLDGFYRQPDKRGRLELGIKLLAMIDRFCSSTLKELKFSNFYSENESLCDVQFDSALSTIERLSFFHCSLQNSFTAFLSACTELKVLRMSWCDLGNVDMWNFDMAMPKLEELRLNNLHITSDRFINGIIHSESKLKNIELIDFSSSTNAWTRVIVQRCTCLLELELTIYGCYTDAQYAESIHRLKQLTSLKVLKVHLMGESTEPLSTVLESNAAPIEHMQLNGGRIDAATIKAISQMKHLKVLELNYSLGITDEYMIELANGLGSKLQKIQLEGPTENNLTTIGLKKMLPFATKLSLLRLQSNTITIDADDYNAMLNIVQKRPEKVRLLIELIGIGDQVEVDEQVQKENRDWFRIDQQVVFGSHNRWR